MAKEIEESILYVVHNIHFTPNRLAIINIFYNASEPGITIPQANFRMPKNKRGKTVSGILSKLAQDIDHLDNPGDKYGFTGYILFFERFNGDLHRIRPEFCHVIDQHSELKNAMYISVDQIYSKYKKGLVL